MSRQTAFELFPSCHAPACEWRVKRAIGELIEEVATPKKGRFVGFPLRSEVLELEYLNALLEHPDTEPVHVPGTRDSHSLMTQSHPDRYIQSPYTKRPKQAKPEAKPNFLRSPAAERIRAARNGPPRVPDMLMESEDIMGERIRYDPADFSGVQRKYGPTFIKTMPEDSDAKKQHDHMMDIYQRAETLVLNNKWWMGPGIDCDYRVYAVEYLPAIFREEVVGVDLLDSLGMLKECIQCIPVRYVSSRHSFDRLKVDVDEFTAFLCGKEEAAW